MAHQKLKSGCKNRPGGALQLRLRQYSERPSGPSFRISLIILSELFLVMSNKSSAQSAEPVSKSSAYVVIGFYTEQISSKVVGTEAVVACFNVPSLSCCSLIVMQLLLGCWLIYLVLVFFATPGQWQDFIPFQSKGQIGPQNS